MKTKIIIVASLCLLLTSAAGVRTFTSAKITNPASLSVSGQEGSLVSMTMVQDVDDNYTVRIKNNMGNAITIFDLEVFNSCPIEVVLPEDSYLGAGQEQHFELALTGNEGFSGVLKVRLTAGWIGGSVVIENEFSVSLEG